jgi:adenine-specific DNA-methyltransferase
MARNRRHTKRPIDSCDHRDKQRANNPPVGLVTPETDPEVGQKKTYVYDSHLDPQLIWSGKAEHTPFEVPTVSLHVHERIDPRSISPYGIKYGSNFQPFVNKRDVKDGKDEDLAAEPEQIRAFRDAWELGIHSYLTYLRDRLLLARELRTAGGAYWTWSARNRSWRRSSGARWTWWNGDASSKAQTGFAVVTSSTTRGLSMWGDEAVLVDIAQAAHRIEAFVEGVDEIAFTSNEEKHWAVVSQLLVIGKAVTRLSDEFASLHPQIEWRKIAGMRNRLIHGYDKIRWDLVWQTATEYVPRLLAYVEPLIPPEEP